MHAILLRLSLAVLSLLTVLSPAAMLQAGDVEDWQRHPLTTAPYMEHPPTIDGSVNQDEWLTGTMIGPLLVEPQGVADELARRVWVGYDQTHLYLAWEIERPAWVRQPRMPTKTGRIDAWRGGDFIEIMIDTRHNHATYYDFAVFANSAYSDGAGSPGVDKGWNPNWQQAAAVTDLGWTGEAAIPFAELGLDGPPAAGTVWGFDFIDNQQTPFRQVATWGFRGPGWHKIKNFGHLRFAGRKADAPVIRFKQAQEAGQGRAVVEFGLVHPGDASAAGVEAHLQLLRRQDGAAGGPKSYYDHIESGSDDAYDAGQTDFAKTTELNGLINQAMSFYAPVQDAAIEQHIEVPAGQRRTVGVAPSIEAGEFLVRYQFRKADGTLLAAGVRPFEIAAPLTLELRPYWLHAQVIDIGADLRKVPHKDDAMLHLALYADRDEDDALAQTQVAVPGGQLRATGTLSTAGLKPGFYKIRAKLTDAQGKQIASSVAAIEKPKPPAWHGNQYGLRVKVPQPWTPLQASEDGIVKVWGRTYDLSTLLPRQITSQGDELLTSPVSMDLVHDGQPVAWRVTSLKLEKTDEGKAVYRGTLESDIATLSGTVAIEFDGFVWYDLMLTPRDENVKIDRMSLAVDLTADHARLLSTHGFLNDPVLSPKPVQPAMRGPDGVLAESLLPFTPHLWMGDETGGVAWMAEAPIDWHVTRPDRVIEVQPAVRGSSQPAQLRVHMIQSPVKLTKTRRVIFGLQASPARPMPPMGTTHIVQTGGVNKQASYYRSLKEHGATGYVAHSGWKGSPKAIFWGGWPERAPDPQRHENIIQGIKAAHENGIKISFYTGWGVATDGPEWEHYRYEMAKMPLENAGFGTYRQSAGLNGAYIDYMAWAIADLVKTYDIDGVFWDSASNLSLDRNTRIGNGWIDQQGRVRPAYAILGTRELFKRIYTLFHGELKDQGQIINFGGSIWCISVFADMFHRGEGRPMHVEKLKHAWEPLANFRADYDGRKYGLAFLAMNKNFKKLPMTVNKHLAVTLLHGWLCKSTGLFTREWAGPERFLYGEQDVPLYKIWQARAWLPLDGQTIRHTYESTGPAHIHLQPDSLLSSAFTSSDGKRMLLVVSNLDDKPIEAAAVKLDLTGLGLTGQGTLHIQDVILDKPVEMHDGSITLDIEPERYRLLKLWRDEP